MPTRRAACADGPWTSKPSRSASARLGTTSLAPAVSSPRRARCWIWAPAVATEEWPPNVPVASARLSAIGAPVVHASSLHLPFGAGAFELVLNRHEELDPAEVARILAPGGRFLAQQVGSDNWRELGDLFPRMTDFGPLFELYSQGLRESGLDIVYTDTHERQTAFGGLGDIVYLLTAAPWTIPDFDVERDLDALLALEHALTHERGIVLTETRYIIEAHKP